MVTDRLSVDLQAPGQPSCRAPSRAALSTTRSHVPDHALLGACDGHASRNRNHYFPSLLRKKHHGLCPARLHSGQMSQVGQGHLLSPSWPWRAVTMRHTAVVRRTNAKELQTAPSCSSRGQTTRRRQAPTPSRACFMPCVDCRPPFADSFACCQIIKRLSNSPSIIARRPRARAQLGLTVFGVVKGLRETSGALSVSKLDQDTESSHNAGSRFVSRDPYAWPIALTPLAASLVDLANGILGTSPLQRRNCCFTLQPRDNHPSLGPNSYIIHSRSGRGA